MFFYFRELEKEEVHKEIYKLNNNKASQHSDIPTKIISDFLYVSINNSIKSSLFPSCLKTADIRPIYKNWKKDLKDSYRPVSILPEEACSKQISEFFENIFSKNQCGFRKGHSTQQCF